MGEPPPTSAAGPPGAQGHDEERQFLELSEPDSAFFFGKSSYVHGASPTSRLRFSYVCLPIRWPKISQSSSS